MARSLKKVDLPNGGKAAKKQRKGTTSKVLGATKAPKPFKSSFGKSTKGGQII